MKTEVIDVTPEMAKEWLKFNTANRNMNLSLVARYKKDMLEGKWSMTHQGIAFYEDGTLCDGQTRLKAIVDSGCTIPFLVTFGIERACGSDVDAHRARNLVDAIKIGGLANWINKTAVSIINFIYFQGSKPSAHAVVDKCETLKKEIQFTERAFTNKIRNVTTAPIYAAVVKAAANGVNEDALIRFCKTLVTGIPNDADEISALRLREYLIQSGANLNRTAAGRIEQHMKAQRAIKAFVNKERISKLMTPSEEIYPIK
jgi:hypothetical protein